MARGGANGGNGGFVETSSKRQLNFTGTVDTRAPKGAVGTLLLDPENYYINATGTAPISDPTASAIAATTLVGLLNTSNVVLSTQSTGANAGDIFVQNTVAWTGDNSLTLSAHRNIQINDNVTISNVGAGSLILRADSQGSVTNTGTVVFQQFTFGSRIDFTGSTGKVQIYYNPTSYTSPTDYTPTGQGGGSRGVTVSSPGLFTAYMLVNTANNLQDMQNNLTGTYALGGDIIANPSHTPIGNSLTPFNGILEGRNAVTGQHHTIDGLSVFSSNGGLFGDIGSSGQVRNLHLTNVNITPYFNQTIGAVAGSNKGVINSVTASGTVGGTGFSGITAGGLVGKNTGQITNSSSSVVVTVGDGNAPTSINIAGGLVGINLGNISGSISSGAVSSGFNSFAGGLVGQNDGAGTITNSSSSSAVTGNSGNAATGISSAIGGLVGFNTGVISASFATGPVSGTGNTSFPNAAMIAGGLVGLNNPGGQISQLVCVRGRHRHWPSRVGRPGRRQLRLDQRLPRHRTG